MTKKRDQTNVTISIIQEVENDLKSYNSFIRGIWVDTIFLNTEECCHEKGVVRKQKGTKYLKKMLAEIKTIVQWKSWRKKNQRNIPK